MNHRRHLFILGLLVSWALLSLSSAAADQANPAGEVHTFSVDSTVHTIDRVYRSMSGLRNNNSLSFLPGPPELIWLTGFKVEMVDAKKNIPVSPEYLCHSHLRFKGSRHDADQRRPKFGTQDWKMVTLVQGKTEVELPLGFGIPILSDEQFVFHSMVINNNPISTPIEIKARSTFKFLKDQEMISPLKPLFRQALTLYVPEPGGDSARPSMCVVQGRTNEDMDMESDQALPMPSTTGNLTLIKSGKKMNYHWIVPPGRHTYRYAIDKEIVPYDTTIHFISVHIHPYCSFFELRDATTGKSVFKSRTKNFKDRIGIDQSESYSSPIGLPVYKDHRYELVAEYNNTTKQDVDAMAIMYMYMHSKDFERANLGK